MVNVLDPISGHAADRPDGVALLGLPGRPDWTYGQLRAGVAAFAESLRADGIAPGDRVLLVAPSLPEFVLAYFGIQACGAVVVPTNVMATRHELAYVLDDAGCSLAFAWHQVAEATSEAAKAAGIPSRPLMPAEPAVESTVESGGGGAVVDRGLDDTAAILYTSGTTDRPKGAQLTVGNLLAAGEIGAACSGGTHEDRAGTALPLFHVFGQAAVMMPTFTSGGSLSLLPRFDAPAVLEMLRRDRLTHTAGVPTMWNAMLHAAVDVDPEDFAPLRVAVSGGASLPGEVARAFEKRFGCTLMEGYGLTETAAIGTFNDIERGSKIGSTGRPVPRTSVEVRDPDGHRCPPGAVGEVFVKGPTVMKGYWKLTEATAAVFDNDGWFRTGDLGEFDDEGDLRIVDRLTDLIIRGGYNVYPSEVEEILYAHPDIVEAAVVGVPDEHYGEEVGALIAPRPGAELTPDAVGAWVREHLSAYKAPRVVRFVPELPKGPTGKVLKRAIDRTVFEAPGRE